MNREAHWLALCDGEETQGGGGLRAHNMVARARLSRSVPSDGGRGAHAFAVPGAGAWFLLLVRSQPSSRHDRVRSGGLTAG